MTLLFDNMLFSICMWIPNGLSAQTSSMIAMQIKKKSIIFVLCQVVQTFNRMNISFLRKISCGFEFVQK